MQFSSNADPGAASAPLLRVRLLGRFVVTRAGTEIPAADFGGRKVRTLVRILATRRGNFVSHDQLSEMLWGDRPPADPAANLQVLVNRARRALGTPEVIVTGSGGYSLAAGVIAWIDTEAFRELVGVADRCSGRSRLDALIAANEQWGGEPLAEDVYAEWAVEYRASLTMLRQTVLEQTSLLALELGAPAEALRWGLLAAEAEPLREVAVLTLVRALAAMGDRVSALDRYDAYRRTLADELGLDPSVEASAVQAELLLGGGSVGAQVVTGTAVFGSLPFVGRRAELAALDEVVGAAGLAVVTGTSGVGKSRLIDVLSSRTSLVVVRAFEAERDDPLSLARGVIRELAGGDLHVLDQLPSAMRSALGRHVPEFAEPSLVADVDSESRRALVTEAAVRVLVTAPCPVVIDDVQWADASSLSVLAAACSRQRAHAVVLVHRHDGGRRNDAVEQLLARVRPDAIELNLQPFTAEEISELTGDPDLLRELVDGTDGTPFAIGEVLRSLSAEGVVGRTSQQRWRALAPLRGAEAHRAASGAQRRVIIRRLATASAGARELAQLLALLAREAPARLLARASAQAEVVVLEQLGQLAVLGIARLGEAGWATAHDMVTAVVSTSLDAAERCRLEVALAEALAEFGCEPGELARHWQAAGDDRLAAESYLRAAARAVEAFALGEGLAHANAGLALVPPPMVAAELAEVRASARSRLGDLSGAREDLRAALREHPTGARRALLLGELALLASGADDLIRAAQLAELAIVAAGDDKAARARALEIGAMLDMNLDREAQSGARAAAAETLFRELGDARGLARVLDGRAMASFFFGQVGEGGALLTRVSDLFEDSGDLLRVVTPRSTAGHALVFAGEPERGLTLTHNALELARSLGYREGQSYALWHSSEALSALGRADEAVAAAVEGLDIAQGVNHRGWQATCLRALGIGHQAAGRFDEALAAFTASLEQSEHFNLFASWAASRAAIVLVALGRHEEAGPLVRRALAEGPPLGHYEARLAAAELANAAGTGSATAREALGLAMSGGYLQGTARLRDLAEFP